MGGVKSVACVLLFLVGFAGPAMGLGFKCNGEGKACQALVGFKTQQRTKLSAISSLFQLSSHRSLLGANGWESSVPANTTLPKGYIVRVPITCGCRNGTGFSRGKPAYTVRKDNTLSVIATDIFAGLVTYQDIAVANNISDPDKIFPDQRLRIPLPCSCDGTSGNGSSNSSVVHFAYIVQAGNSLQGIAVSFGTSEVELKTVNGIVNASALLAGQVIDVPLKACSSKTSKHWSDRKLLVANGSYAITASQCVLCSCGPRDLDLYCAPAPLTTSCPSMQCENSNLTIGNFTTQKTDAGCNVTTCSYSGYIDDKILTSLSSSVQPECPGMQYKPLSLLWAIRWSRIYRFVMNLVHVWKLFAYKLSRLTGATLDAAKHALPIFTRPSSTSPPPPAAISSPENSPSPGSFGSTGTAPASGLSGQKSAAAGSLRCPFLCIVLILGLPFLIHFGDW